MSDLPPFQQLLDAHGVEVHRFIARSVGPHASDDVWQETLLSALRAYPDLHHATSLRGWLFTIARHRIVDAWREAGRRPVPVQEVPDQPSAPADSPDGSIWQRVRTLPEGQREALALRFGADLAYRDIAGLLGCSEEAARQRVRAGLNALRQLLEPLEVT